MGSGNCLLRKQQDSSLASSSLLIPSNEVKAVRVADVSCDVKSRYMMGNGSISNFPPTDSTTQNSAKMALRRRLQEYKPPDAPKKRSTKLNYFLYVAVLAVLVSSSLFKARDYLSEIQESLLILADFTAISAPTVRLPVRSTPDSEKEPSLSENLESEDYFMRNSRNLTFQTNVRVWNETGKICLNITLRDPDGSCRYPYFRARLSGVAVMDIPIGGRSLDLDNHFDPNGCALFPVPGNYTLDVVLLHCTMNAWPHDASSGILRSQCPVLPEPRDNVGTYKISVGPFERDDNLVSSLWPLRNPFPRRAFVYFRPCPGERYRIASRCTAASNEEPPVVRVSYQRAGVEYNEKPAIFDKYVYLEVDANNGAVNYSSGYTLSRYAPPPQDFESEDTVCFLGDSHARYLSYQTRMIYLNKATGKTGCAERELHTSVDIKTGQFRYVVMEFALNFLSGKGINETLFAGCDMVVILYGHWDAVSERWSIE